VLCSKRDVALYRHLSGVVDALGYLQHHLQELTECQNTLEHTINTTLAGLTAQLHQLTQLMTSPAPADGDQREFDLETRVTANGNLIIPEMFHSCALNK